MNKLTQKQYDFTMSYIRNGFNAYQAALDAGYKRSMAVTSSHSLVKLPQIQARIEKHFNEMESKLGITVAWKAKKLKKLIDDIIPDNDDDPKRSLYAQAIKALSELNRMSGDYAPNKSIQVTYDDTKNKLLDARKIYDEY